MNGPYRKLLRTIIEAKIVSSRFAVLVRGGWSPLLYELALRVLTILFKIRVIIIELIYMPTFTLPRESPPLVET